MLIPVCRLKKKKEKKENLGTESYKKGSVVEPKPSLLRHHSTPSTPHVSRLPNRPQLVTLNFKFDRTILFSCYPTTREAV